MNIKKQVDKQHYVFDKYLQKERWISIWHQINEALNLKPSNVLEIGPGPGIFKLILGNLGVKVETCDIDPELNPDHVASATDLPFSNNYYDCICAFQMLEHLPYPDSLKAFSEMVRVSKKIIVISLPDSKKIWKYRLPIFKDLDFQIPQLFYRGKIHKFDGQHYWEINKRNYLLEKIITDFSNANVKLVKTYRVKENPYHRFFIFEKQN